MRNTYLLDIIRAFSTEEHANFLLFLESPYHNKGAQSAEITSLYQIILEYAPDFSSESLEKEHVYARVFPRKPIIEGKIEKLMAELTKLLRSFSIFEKLSNEDNENKMQLEWIGWLRERGLGNRFKQAISKLKNNIDGSDGDSLKKYKYKSEIAEEEVVWEVTNNVLRGDLNIPNFLEKFDQFYFNLRGDMVLMFLIQQKAAKSALTDSATINALEPSVVDYHNISPLLKLNNRFLLFLRKETPTVEDFTLIVDELKANEKLFTQDTISIYYSHLRNFCTLLIDDGHTSLVPVLHDLNKDNLKRGYFFSEGKIRFNAYLSLVQIALRSKDVAWAFEFTEKYKTKILGGDESQFYYNLNYANCLFSNRKFEEALGYIPDTAPSTIYLLLIKRLELKAYYELKSDLLYYKIDAFRKFVERTALKSVSINLQKMNLNFIHILTQMAQSPLKSPKRSSQLISRIENKKLIGERAWLLEKARELA